MRDAFTVDDISERIMGELNAVIAEAILKGQSNIPTNALISIQANNRSIAKEVCAELDKELSDFGMRAVDFIIADVNYPEEVQKVAEQAAATSFVGDVGKFAAVQMAQSFNNPNGGGADIASAGAQMGMGLAMAQQMMNGQTAPQAWPQQQAQPQPAADRFCPKCRKMVSGKFCSECGTETV